jgi:16S rRNA (cytosine1402-N4)-methyltransferase
MHTSVFLNEAVKELQVAKNKKYVDATFGQGGHAKLIRQLGGDVIGIDRDKSQVDKEKDMVIYQGNFSQIDVIVKKHGFKILDGVIFDLGLSMEQLKTGNRGLSFKNDDEPLDMRLDDKGFSASDLLNKLSYEQLENELRRNCEDLNSSKIAKEIVMYRKKIQNVWTVGDLKNVILNATSLSKEASLKTFARVFQALRMMVNDELQNIKDGINKAFELLTPGGTIVVITFHSVEDRVVKKILSALKDRGHVKRVQVEKSRSLLSFERSAKLRAIQKYD